MSDDPNDAQALPRLERGSTAERLPSAAPLPPVSENQPVRSLAAEDQQRIVSYPDERAFGSATSNPASEDYAPYHFPDFESKPIIAQEVHSPDPAQETLTLSIELGRQFLEAQAAGELRPGSQIILKQLATEPVDLYVRQQHVGQGELLIRNNKLCIRITRLLAGALQRSA